MPEKKYGLINERSFDTAIQQGAQQPQNQMLQPVSAVQQQNQGLQPISTSQPAAQQDFKLAPPTALPMSPALPQSPELKSAKLSDFAAEAAKIYGTYNQGGYKQQLQPTIDYMQSQIPTLSENFMKKAYGQNVNPETGLGGQISAKLLSDFQTNVLAPVMQQIGTQQALRAPQEQLALAQYLQTGDQSFLDKQFGVQKEAGERQFNLNKEQQEKEFNLAEARRTEQINFIKDGISSGQVKQEQVIPMLSQIYGIDPKFLTGPDMRKSIVDQYVQDSVIGKGITPNLVNLNNGLIASGFEPMTQEEFDTKFKGLSSMEAPEVKVSYLISKLNANQLDKPTAVDYGIPFKAEHNQWTFRDTPETRNKIKYLYANDKDFKSWFDFSTGS